MYTQLSDWNIRGVSLDLFGIRLHISLQFDFGSWTSKFYFSMNTIWSPKQYTCIRAFDVLSVSNKDNEGDGVFLSVFPCAFRECASLEEIYTGGAIALHSKLSANKIFRPLTAVLFGNLGCLS